MFSFAIGGVGFSEQARRRFALPLLGLLIAGGFAGNYFNVLLFLDIHFLFGSVFAMLALQFFGTGPGVLVAALISSYTYVLWNEPYAIVIMTAELAVVGALMERRRIGMVLADTIFWLAIGMPLAYFFYADVLRTPLSSTAIIITKQALNGIGNALLGRLIFTGFSLATRSSQVTLGETIYNLLTAFVLVPALVLLTAGGRADFTSTDSLIRTSLRQQRKNASQYMDQWAHNQKRAITHLAGLASTYSPQQMQAHLDQARLSDDNFERLGLLDHQAVFRAYSPQYDELGQSPIGKSTQGSPILTKLKQLLKPMLSEVVISRVGKPRPIVLLVAPVLNQGQFAGYVAGTLNLAEIRTFLDQGVTDHASRYTLLDKGGNVILTNYQGQTVMQPFVRGRGKLSHLDAQIDRWVPPLPANTPASERWRDSLYVTETRVGDLAEWTLILEQPVAPFQKALYDDYTRKLLMLLGILLLALALAELLSRRTLATVKNLSALTHDLPTRLSAPSNAVTWPETAVQETAELIENLKVMAQSLAEQFAQVRKANENLERKVDDRTQELRENEKKLSLILNSVDACIYLKDLQGRYLFANHSMCELTATHSSELIGCSDEDLFDAASAKLMRANDRLVLDRGETVRTEEQVVTRRGPRRVTLLSVKLPLHDKAGVIYALCAVSTDITRRKALEDEVRQLAFYDPLTLLPNRRLLDDRLGQALAASKRNGQCGALMMIDLDNFKPINDEFGHQIGDQLLAEVARRLVGCVRETDSLARFGGDEFVVMLGELSPDLASSLSQAETVAEKIRVRLAEPYLLAVNRGRGSETSVEHHCTASLGVALFTSQDADAQAIITRADRAMYRAKRGGRNLVHFGELPSSTVTPP